MTTYEESKLTIMPASLSRRILVTLIDIAIIPCVAFITHNLEIVRVPILEKICSLYFLISLAGYNTTLGGKILKTFTVNNNGEKILCAEITIRSLYIFMYIIMALVTCMKYFHTLFDDIIVLPALMILTASYYTVSLSMLFITSQNSIKNICKMTMVVYIPNQKA